MFERILVPLDGSNAAEAVLPYVEGIAARFGSEITLVGVSELSPVAANHLYQTYLNHVVEETGHGLRDYGTKEKTSVRAVVLQGKPADEILNCADEGNVGLIAMASRGSSGRGPWLLGNVAGKVLRAANRPVLLIRAPASGSALQKKQLIKRILVPLDGSTVAEAVIPYAETLGRTLDAELVFFQVLEPAGQGHDEVVPGETLEYEESRRAFASASLERAAKPYRERGLGVSTVLGFGHAANQIIDYAEANAIDLIAMSTHGRSGIGRWVFGSVTDKVLHAGNTPVLVVRAKEV
jgi:nucleotide-binding universal stress UspA family protein